MLASHIFPHLQSTTAAHACIETAVVPKSTAMPTPVPSLTADQINWAPGCQMLRPNMKQFTKIHCGNMYMIVHPNLVTSPTRAKFINQMVTNVKEIKRHYPNKNIKIIHIPIGPGGFGTEKFLDEHLVKNGFNDRLMVGIDLWVDPRTTMPSNHHDVVNAFHEFAQDRGFQAGELHGVSNSEGLEQFLPDRLPHNTVPIYLVTEVDPPQLFVEQQIPEGRLKVDGMILPHYAPENVNAAYVQYLADAYQSHPLTRAKDIATMRNWENDPGVEDCDNCVGVITGPGKNVTMVHSPDVPEAFVNDMKRRIEEQLPATSKKMIGPTLTHAVQHVVDQQIADSDTWAAVRYLSNYNATTNHVLEMVAEQGNPELVHGSIIRNRINIETLGARVEQPSLAPSLLTEVGLPNMTSPYAPQASMQAHIALIGVIAKMLGA